MSAAGRIWLFVPGDRPDRFDRAFASGADSVVIDLEDSVGVAGKEHARAAVLAALQAGREPWVRINAVDTPWHEADISALRDHPPAGLMIPKAESGELLAQLAALLPLGIRVVALVESAAGIEAALSLAAEPRVDRLAFGSIDFALDVRCEHTPEALLHARSRLVVASRAAGIEAPLDGVTTVLDPEQTLEDARRARALGMGGKLCIHPSQIAPARSAWQPSLEELDAARRIVQGASTAGGAAVLVDGHLVDKPVVDRARRLLLEVDDQ